MRNLLAMLMFTGLGACGPNERVDAFELGTTCDVGESISDCAGFAPIAGTPGSYIQDVEQPLFVLGVPVSDVRLRVTDGLVTRVYAEYALDFCPIVEARLHQDLGRENRNDLTFTHWRGAAYTVDLDYPLDRAVCSVVVEERSTAKPFGS